MLTSAGLHCCSLFGSMLMQVFACAIVVMCSTAAKRPRHVLPGDSFDCGICLEPMIRHIFQCSTGHSFCESCLEKIRRSDNTCPECKQCIPSSPPRNFSMERMAGECNFPCRFGCGTVARPEELREHEYRCDKAPLACPCNGCAYRLPSSHMKKHLLEKHQCEPTNMTDGGLFRCKETSWHVTFDCAPGWYLSNTLLDSENAALLICDCATVDDNFVMKLLHFTQAYKCTVTWKRGEMHGLRVTLPSRRLADIAMVHNFVVPLTMCEPFFETWDNGILECTCVVSVEPITAQEVA